MTDASFPALDITDHWGRLNDELVTLVDYVPDERMDWSPQPNLWSFRGIILHIAGSRDYWMGGAVKDGEQVPNVVETAQSKEGMRRELRRSWHRLLRFLAHPANLSKEYRGEEGGQEWRLTGHWIAFHLLEHDIHHRADIFHYLALLGIEHPQVGTP